MEGFGGHGDGRPGAGAPSGSQASPGAADASPPSVSIPDAELLDLADRLECTYADWNPAHPHTGVGGAFATMCLMSDALKALSGDGSLVGNKRSPREIVADLRAAASRKTEAPSA